MTKLVAEYVAVYDEIVKRRVSSRTTGRGA
jgi:hypothetical protein